VFVRDTCNNFAPTAAVFVIRHHHPDLYIVHYFQIILKLCNADLSDVGRVAVENFFKFLTFIK